MRIEQRKLDPIAGDSYSKVLTDISNYLNCILLTKKQKSTSNEYYTLVVLSKTSIKIIVKYLDKHPLFSSRYLDYKDWKGIVLLMFENKHYTEQDIAKPESVTKDMNRKRTHFTWDHLNILSL